MKRIKPAPYRFTYEQEMETPPPFVRCGCKDGYVLIPCPDGMEGCLVQHEGRCKGCKNSPLPGWMPVYYTPKQYRDWIRREDDLPEYELPDSIPVWYRDKGGIIGWIDDNLSVAMRIHRHWGTQSYIVIRNEAGRPPKDYRP